MYPHAPINALLSIHLLTHLPIIHSSTRDPPTHAPTQIPTHPPMYPLTHLPTIHSRLPSHPFIYLLVHKHIDPSTCPLLSPSIRLHIRSPPHSSPHSFIHPATDIYHCFIHPPPATHLPTYPITDQPDTIHLPIELTNQSSIQPNTQRTTYPQTHSPSIYPPAHHHSRAQTPRGSPGGPSEASAVGSQGWGWTSP